MSGSHSSPSGEPFGSFGFASWRFLQLENGGFVICAAALFLNAGKMTGFLETVGAFMLATTPAVRVANEQYSDNSADLGQLDSNPFISCSEIALDNPEETRLITRSITRDNPYGEDLLPLADTKEFVVWLRVHNAKETEITRRKLLSFYFEFCDEEFEPLSDASLLRQIKSAGITSRRLTPKKINGKFVSPTVYQIQPAKQKRSAAP